MSSFFGDNSYDVSKLYFEAISSDPYNNYVLIPPKQKLASELTEPAMKNWGLEIRKRTATEVDLCSRGGHGEHEYMLPFYKSNSDLMSYYTHIMNGRDETKKEAINDDYLALVGIEQEPVVGKHQDTKFHCLGGPIDGTETDYKELDWATRLYYSIRQKLPEGVSVCPVYRYANNFRTLQKLYSSNAISRYYHFKAIPDMIFSKRPVAGAALYLCDEIELLEIKPGGRLQQTRTSDIPNAYAQVVGGLHFLAVAHIIRSIMNNRNLGEVSCKGLLVNRKSSLTFFNFKSEHWKGNLCRNKCGVQ